MADDNAIAAVNRTATTISHPAFAKDTNRTGEEAEISALRARLEAPVRVAFAGRKGSGKSSLINLLLGSNVLPTAQAQPALPPVVFRHATEERTTADWWDLPGQVFSGIALAPALELQPDLVTIELNCDALRDLWLIEIPALDDTAHNREALFALSQLADVLVWCADGCAFGDHDDRKFKARMPVRQARNATLALTFMDKMTDQQDETAQATLQSGRTLPFRSCVPIATPLASKALAAGTDTMQDLWSDSGAEDLIGAIFDMVSTYREDRTQRIEREIARISAGEHEAPTGLPEVPPSEPTPRSDAQSDARHKLLAAWQAAITDLSSSVERGEIADNSEFVGAVRECVEEFLETLAQSETLPPDAGWIIEEFGRADNLLVLLQFEEAEDVAADAARILVQLSDSLAGI